MPGLNGVLAIGVPIYTILLTTMAWRAISRVQFFGVNPCNNINIKITETVYISRERERESFVSKYRVSVLITSLIACALFTRIFVVISGLIFVYRHTRGINHILLLGVMDMD